VTRLVTGLCVAAIVLAACDLLLGRIEGDAPGSATVGSHGSNELTWHATRLWALAPGTTRSMWATCTVGEDGLRGPRPEVPRPTGRERILVLGDSSWFGAGLADQETFAVQLQGRLRRRGLDLDVVNGGVPGYSTEQALLELEEIGWDYQPTLLLIGNLWSDNNFDAWHDADLLQRRSPIRALLGKSALYRWLSRSVTRLQGGSPFRVVTWPDADGLARVGQRRVPLADYARNLDTMIRDARERGIGAALLAPGNRPIAQSGLSKNQCWYAYFTAQAQVAEHHGVPLVRGYEVLKAAAAEAGLDAVFLDELHPTAEGQGVLADAAALALDAAGWPTARLLGAERPFDPGLLDADRFPEGSADRASIQLHFASPPGEPDAGDPGIPPTPPPRGDAGRPPAR
jgi:lysophospholipase L1-like esterase